MCQNNIDQSVYDDGFKQKFGLTFHCPECMTECMTLEVKTGKLSKTSNKVSEIVNKNTLEHVLLVEEVTSEKGFI